MTFRTVGCLNVLLFLVIIIFSAHPPYFLMLTAAQLLYVPFMLHVIMKKDKGWVATYLPSLSVPAFLAVLFLHITDQTAWDTLLATLYFMFTILIALYGIIRFLKRGFVNFEEFVIDAGFFYIVVGGAWFLAYEANIDTGFSTTLTWLTSIHFHYASFLLLLFVGLLGRLHKSSFYIFISWMVIIAPILVAAGISYSPVLELLSVLVYIIGIYGFIVLSFKITFQHIMQKFLIRASFCSLGLTILFSLLYTVSHWAQAFEVTIDFMLYSHGVMNTILFALMGLVGWSMNVPSANSKIPSFPMSKIRGSGAVGEKVLTGKMDGILYNGLVDDMRHFEPSIDTQTLSSMIIDFYENTNDYKLFAEVKWHTWFKPFAGVYRLISRYVKQINLPLSRKQVEMTGDIFSVKDALDGRYHTRAWVRKIKEDVTFVALYSSHQEEGRTYMNISLPLPFSAMTGILELNQSGNELILTSESQQRISGPGIYLAVKNHLFKLPIDERFHVKEGGKGTLQAYHRMTMFHLPFLTIDYHIYERKSTNEGK
ncbi:YndJ family protein [Salibacterium salarium]|uniref:YndJ family protein n=1 Tax=Salibacterium salarium TaxID=284579 RepID=UPI0027D83635|nr:YndJ family protein [Salibacterium salarium]